MWDWDDNDGMFILCILMKTKNRLSQQIRYWKSYYIFIFIFIRQRKLNNTNEKIAHLSWCALIALYINNHRHPSQDAAQEDLFLRRWLINAQHQKRFPKEVAGSLNDIICYSRQLSRKVRIKEYLLDIWNSYSRSEEDPLSLWSCPQHQYIILRYSPDKRHHACWKNFTFNSHFFHFAAVPGLNYSYGKYGSAKDGYIWRVYFPGVRWCVSNDNFGNCKWQGCPKL